MADKEIHSIIIALGTNTEHEHNINKALCLLDDIVFDIKYSRKLWTSPIGIMSDMFLNMLVSGRCNLTLPELCNVIKSIETKCGRLDDDKKRGIVKIDIDILQYDNQKEHADDWQRKYIKTLIKEL